MSRHKIDVENEIWDKCSEYLEMIPEESWDQFLLPVFYKMLVSQRELTEYYKKRLETVHSDRGTWE